MTKQLRYKILDRTKTLAGQCVRLQINRPGWNQVWNQLRDVVYWRICSEVLHFLWIRVEL